MTAVDLVWRITRLRKIVDQEAFTQRLDLELHKAIRLGYCVSIVFMMTEPEAAGRYGSFRGLAEILAGHTRATDLVAIIPPRFLGLLLVDAPRSSLQQIVDRLSTRAGLDETLTPWSAGASTYPETGQRVEDLLRQATELMARADADGGNRLYLP